MDASAVWWVRTATTALSYRTGTASTFRSVRRSDNPWPGSSSLPIAPDWKASVTRGSSSAAAVVPTASDSSTVAAVLGRHCATHTMAPSSRRTHIR